MRLIGRPGLTALLAPNQVIGINCFYWLTSSGISVPDDLSIVMFDNFSRFRHIPVSTVDFRFNLLGYKAAHIFIGDIPIHAERWSNIGSEPRLRDRGTLAAPRKNDTIFLPHIADRK